MNKAYVIMVPFNRRSSYSVPLTFVVEAENMIEAVEQVERKHPHVLDYGFTASPVDIY